MKSYPEDYEKYVEHTNDRIFKEYIQEEMKILRKLLGNKKDKILIECGAGYGRVILPMSELSKHVVGIENDKDMFKSLKDKTKYLKNVTIIQDDVLKLNELLEEYKIPSENRVVCCLQNTLGVLKGDSYNLLDEMKRAAKNGEIFISLLNRESLKKWGINFYTSLPFSKDVDLKNSDFNNGIFKTKSGYQSKWWSIDETKKIADILEIKPNFQISPFYIILYGNLEK